jgi:hypothetical protein
MYAMRRGDSEAWQDALFIPSHRPASWNQEIESSSHGAREPGRSSTGGPFGGGESGGGDGQVTQSKREVYEKVPQPHYLQEFIPSLNLEIGEDIYFCQQAQKAGYQIWCDQELSREVAHIGIFHFNYNLSVPQ